MTDDNGTNQTEPIETVEPVPAAQTPDLTEPAPAVEAVEPTVLSGQPVPRRKAPWQMWAAVAVGVVLMLAIGARAAFGFAHFVAFHGHRAGFTAASVQRFDGRHGGVQDYRFGRGFERRGFGRALRGRS